MIEPTECDLWIDCDVAMVLVDLELHVIGVEYVGCEETAIAIAKDRKECRVIVGPKRGTIEKLYAIGYSVGEI